MDLNFLFIVSKYESPNCEPIMIKDIIWVGLGGFAGSAARYLINVKLSAINWPIPWPTLTINILGSFLIGVLMAFSYKVAKAVERAVPCERVGMSVIGLEVPHVHVHLIPLHSMEDANFSKKEELSKEMFQMIANEISKNFKNRQMETATWMMRFLLFVVLDL